MSWLHVEGTAEEQIPRALLPAVPPEGEGPKAPPAVQGRATSEGVNITGLFDAELGVGEAARLLAQAVAAAGIPYRTSAYEKTRSRRRHAFEAQVSETPFDVNIVCLNADLTPSFARSVGPGFFEGRYTIGYWFWEVAHFPLELGSHVKLRARFHREVIEKLAEAKLSEDQVVKPIDGEWFALEATVPHTRALHAFLVGYGPHCVVEAPKALRAHVLDDLQRAVALYER